MKKFLLFIITAAILFSSFPSFLTANAEKSDDFIESLLLLEDIDLPYKVNEVVYQAIKADTGQDDLYKTYIVTGKPTSSYLSGKQYFENGRYEKEKWIPDSDAAASFIERAIEIYLSLERTLTNDKSAAARAIISYGFEALPAMSRIRVENAPNWLVGKYLENRSVISYAEKNVITSTVTDGSFSKRIRNDRDICNHSVCFNAKNGGFCTVNIPKGSEYFTAYVSTDFSFSSSFSDALLKVYLVDGNNNKREVGIYCIYRGYENRVEIKLEGAEKIRFEISFVSNENTIKIILADASFISFELDRAPVKINEGSITPLGDCNRDGIVNALDTEALIDTLLLKLSPDSVCDVNQDGDIDFIDLLCLENYIIYVRNMNRIYDSENQKLSVVVLGDSIARGYGLEGSENGVPSPLAYGALVARALEEQTKYSIDYANYGHDGDTVSDLMRKLKTSGSREQKGAKSADLIMLSIGGNNFLQALKKVFEDYFDIDTSNPQAVLSQLSNISYTEIIKFLVSDTIDSAVDEAAKVYSKEAKELITYISSLNPDAEILLTTIPNTAPDADFVYKLTVPLLGQHDILIGNLHTLANEWLCYFNEVIELELAEYPVDNFGVVNVDSYFDGSFELTLMDISEKVYVNDLASGNFKDVRHLDVHPSAKGHEIIASEHVSALGNKIKAWNNEYTGTIVQKDEYFYSKSSKATLGQMVTETESTNEGKILFRAKIENANKLCDLFVNIGFDSELLKLAGVDINSDTGVLYNTTGGVFRLLSRDASILPKTLDITLTFENISKSDKESVISAVAKESLLLFDGALSETSEVENEITLAAVDNKGEESGEDSDTDDKKDDSQNNTEDGEQDGSQSGDNNNNNNDSNNNNNNGNNNSNGGSNGENNETSNNAVMNSQPLYGKIIIYVVFIAAILAIVISLAIAAVHIKKKDDK